MFILSAAIILFLVALGAASLYLKQRDPTDEEIQDAHARILPQPYSVSDFATELREDLRKRLPAQIDTNAEIAPSEIDLDALERKADDRRGYVYAAADASIFAGYSVLHKHMAVDDQVYEGISRLAGQEFTSFADLSAKVETYSHTMWEGLSDGALNKVGGHIAEVEVADHFEKAGLDVEWPSASNQEGWDLLIDGNEVNVKNVADAEDLYNHFQDHPDIPAVIPADAENIPDGAVEFDPLEGTEELMEAIASGQEEGLVIIDDALSQEDVLEQTADATDALLGDGLIESGTGLDGGFPIITVAFSGWREIGLHSEGKTDWKTSTKNISLDTAGAGGGGFAGAKGGAAAGALLGGPLGATIGGVLGAIGGAMAGRKASNHVKRKPFREAEEAFENAQQELTKTAEEQEKRAQKKFAERREQEEEKLKEKSTEYSEKVGTMVQRARSQQVEIAAMGVSEARGLLNKALTEIAALKGRLVATQSTQWFQIRNRFFPTAHTLAISEAIEWTEKVEMKLRRKLDRLENEDVIDRAQISETLGQWGLCRERVLQSIAEVECMNTNAKVKIARRGKRLREDFLRVRTSAMERVGAYLVELREEMRAALKPKIQTVQTRQEKLAAEADKLGK